jgi:hypothetical protein
MPTLDLTGRLTLHDILGYFLSGSWAMIIFSIITISNRVNEIYLFPALSDAFLRLHLSMQVACTVVAAYILGLICNAIGDLLFSVFGHKELPGEHHSAYSVEVLQTLQERINIFAGSTAFANSFELQRHLAYSYLINNEKDGFVQAMSAKGAMYSGIAGSSLLAIIFTLITSLLSHHFTTGCCWFNLAIILLAFSGMFWGLSGAKKFDRLWKRHVVFGFLAENSKWPHKLDYCRANRARRVPPRTSRDT